MDKHLFKSNRNTLEQAQISLNKRETPRVPSIPNSLCISCPNCKAMLFSSDLEENLNVCPKCGHHCKMSAREKIRYICDAGTFKEWDENLTSKNALDFPGYSTKLNNSRISTMEKDGVITGRAKIDGRKIALFVMDPYFMMGSMGSVVGEKITRLFEKAAEEDLPVIGFTVSGGARMQEGILSLMQMAKTSGAVKKHSDCGNLYITVLTDPTTGGVTASFAMQGDIIIAEPNALIAFAGPRVIEQTMRQKLPAGFQRAEFLLEKGFVDAVVDRKDQRSYLSYLIRLHEKEEQ